MRGSFTAPPAPEPSRPAFDRFTTRERSTTGAGRSIVTSYDMATMWRCSSDTSRVLRTRTCLPDGVAHNRSRVRIPLRMSRTRRYSGMRAVGTNSGSSSTYSSMIVASGTLTIV